MPGGVLPYQDGYIHLELGKYMADFDYRIGTLEAAIGTGLSYDPVKMNGRANIVYARNEDFYRVKEMGFDVVSLANNHIWDLGKDGLENTIRILKENGIKYCGAGMNIEEASEPAVIEKDGITVAILAYCMYGNPWLGYVELADENKAGVNPLDIDKVVSDIGNAKKRYNKVIVMPHWGCEYQYEPMDECVKMAKAMIKAGADAVLGSHPHQVQPLIYYKGKPVCFSMGNFLFPDFYMYPPRPIWYPQSLDEVKDVKEVVGYPYPIEEPIKQVWNPVSRYGCTIGYESNLKKTVVSQRFVHSSMDNVVSMSDPSRQIKRELKKTSFIISNQLLYGIIKTKRKVNTLVANAIEKMV